MKRLTTLLAVVIASIGIASCGGHAAKPTVKLRQAHPCTVNYYMQCAVGQPSTARRPSLLLGLSPQRFGVDFAWGGPACSTIRSHGASFGASYLSNSSKDWTGGLIASYRNGGCGIVFVWETSASRSLDGYNAGYSDAFNATHEAAALGYPHAHIDFATDFDSSNYGRAFEPYYQGAAAWDRRAGATTGAYGGLHTVVQLCADGITTANWQTLAWSYGSWASTSCAPLRQTSINNSWFGYSVDYNYSLAAYYGQSNYVAPPPPGPTHAQILSWARARASSIVAYHRYHCKQPVLGSGACEVFGSRVNHFQVLLDQTGVRPMCFGKHAALHAAICQIVRPAVATFSRAVVSSHRAFVAQKCLPPLGGEPVKPGNCALFWNRQIHFQGRANHLLGTSRY
jgi:hypothetical protein